VPQIRQPSCRETTCLFTRELHFAINNLKQHFCQHWRAMTLWWTTSYSLMMMITQWLPSLVMWTRCTEFIKKERSSNIH
jgi:hypothetical protein